MFSLPALKKDTRKPRNATVASKLAGGPELHGSERALAMQDLRKQEAVNLASIQFRLESAV